MVKDTARPFGFATPISAMLAICAALSSTGTAAQSWNAAAEFSTPPASPWSYKQRPGANCLGNATPLPYAFAGVAGWPGYQGVATSEMIPWVIKNPNTNAPPHSLFVSADNVLGSIDAPPGSLLLHPGHDVTP